MGHIVVTLSTFKHEKIIDYVKKVLSYRFLQRVPNGLIIYTALLTCDDKCQVNYLGSDH